MEQSNSMSEKFAMECDCPVCYQLLVDPVTINCGHNICRLCLARWYLSSRSRNTHCPVCRTKWMGQPHVNITLNNLIEHYHGQTVAERKREMEHDPECKKTLETFEKELGPRSQDARSPPPEHVGFFSGIIVAVVAAMVGYFLLYLSGIGAGRDNSQQLTDVPVALWTTPDVIIWMNSLGWAREYADIAKLHHIDGRKLLYTDASELNRILNVKTEAHQQALQVAVETLHSLGMKMPQTVWEYQALYPCHTLYLTYAMKDYPRFAMVVLYLFNYDESFLPFIHTTLPVNETSEADNEYFKKGSPSWSQWLMFWLMMLLFPYGMIGLFAWSLRSTHTITHLAVIITCLLQTLFELSFYSSCVVHGRWREWKTFVKNQVTETVMMGMYACLVPIVPSIICYILFILHIYLTPIHLASNFLQIVMR